jgi:molybdate transport system substrate-binding protein
MGLEQKLTDRLRPMGAGEPPIAAAQGRVQYAIAPLSRIIAASGVVPVATFPDELDLNIDMSMFIHVGSKRHGVARQLIRFLSDPAHDAYLRSHGISRYG